MTASLSFLLSEDDHPHHSAAGPLEELIGHLPSEPEVEINLKFDMYELEIRWDGPEERVSDRLSLEWNAVRELAIEMGAKPHELDRRFEEDKAYLLVPG